MTRTLTSTRVIPASAPRLVLAALAVSVLTACGSSGPNRALEDSRTQVNDIATRPVVTQHAPLEIKTATDTLQRAERVWQKDGDEDEVAHWAYIARQQAATALAQAEAREADEQVKQARSEADRLRLQTRTQQLNTTQAELERARQHAAASQAHAQSLESRLQELEAQQTERGLLVTLGDVLFEFGKSELLPSATTRMDKLADFLRQNPERRVLIEGYTDSVGTAAANQTLSERRAQAVQQALVRRGIERERLAIRGYGKNHPVASNASAEGRALNRRVEVLIADANGNLRGR